MVTRFSKMTKRQKTVTTIFFTVIVTSTIFVLYYFGGVQYAIFFLVVIPLTVGILTFYERFYRPKLKSKSGNDDDVKWVAFSQDTKDLAKKRQNGRCAKCHEYPNHWEFDHIESRGDNSLRNCQGLCLDCHQDKTERERNSKR